MRMELKSLDPSPLVVAHLRQIGLADLPYPTKLVRGAKGRADHRPQRLRQSVCQALRTTHLHNPSVRYEHVTRYLGQPLNLTVNRLGNVIF